MDRNEYLEIINGNGTYETIAKELLQNKTVGIGWTDEEYTHFDIIFKLGLDIKEGSFQRGIKKEYLFVSIIDHTSYGFVPNTIKEVDIEITDFYERNGVIENKHRICSNCKHYHTMNCPNSSECYSISYKPFYEKKIEEIK